MKELMTELERVKLADQCARAADRFDEMLASDADAVLIGDALRRAAEALRHRPPRSTNESLTPAQQCFREDLRTVLEELEKGLIEKNDAYGDSALNPVRCFARDLDLEAQIRVRMDDKLSRLMRGEIKPGTDVAAEDVIRDLLGYLVIYRIAQLRRK